MQEESHNFWQSAKIGWSKLNKEKKIAFAALLFCGAFLFAFSYMSVMDGIKAPFRGSIAELRKNKDLLKDPDVMAADLAKRIDTDGDGISDWVETNVYHTSPYLWSTAGDNVPDNVKIALGENPFCKHGEPCGLNEQMKFNLETTTLPYQDLSTNSVGAAVTDYTTGNSQQAQQFQQEAAAQGVDVNVANQIPRDPVVLRKALLESGKVTQADLDKVTDAQLLQMFDEAMVETKQKQAAALQKPGTDATDAPTTTPKL